MRIKLYKALVSLFFSLILLGNQVSLIFAATFTAGQAKRDAPGPFTAAPIVQQSVSVTAGEDVADQVSSATFGTAVGGQFFRYLDSSQGTVVFWWTPEFSSGQSISDAGLFRLSNRLHGDYSFEDSRFEFALGSITFNITVSTPVTAGTTYFVAARWDRDNVLSGSNYASVTINDSHSFGTTSYNHLNIQSFDVLDIGFNEFGNDDSAQGIIEGFTVYRRPLYEADTPSGIDVGNGDELAQIYNSGSGKDPTLITGSWDVVFALPTNSSTGALSTGTGEAWSHPHSSNILYTDTTNTGGFMLNGTYTDDGWRTDGNLYASNTTGNSLSFDGGDYVRIPDTDNDIDFGTGDFTLMVWVKTANGYDCATDKGMLNRYDGTLALRVGCTGANGYAYFALRDSNSVDKRVNTTVSVNDGNWHHVAAVKENQNPGTISVYVDGVFANSEPTVYTGNFDSTVDFNLGRLGGSYYLTGVLDDFRMYKRALTGDEINETMYKSSLSGSELTNLIGWWKMDEGSGQTIADSSGNGNDGELGSGSGVDGADPTWDTSTYEVPVSALASANKIYAGGYSTVSNGAANGGIYYDETVTAGDDWVVRALAHSDGTSQPKIILYDQTNGAEIGSLTGTTTSTRADPDVFIFTGEAPSGMTTLRVKLINTASSGTTYWHQVEVLSNLFSNPSMETGSGDPFIPTGYGIATGFSSAGQASQESTVVHSGTYSWKAVPGASEGTITYQNDQNPGATGAFLGLGFWGREDAGEAIMDADSSSFVKQYESSTSFNILSLSGASFAHYPAVLRATAGFARLRLRNLANTTAYWDDLYLYRLSDVSVTVTPASEANSTENTDEIRVDGRDTYVESSASSLGTTSGYMSFDYRPRHSAANAVKFAETTSDDAYIVSLNGDSDDYVRVYWDSANTIAMSYSMNGTTGSGTWDATGAIAANTEYAVALSYTGGSTMVLSIGGTDRITLSSIPAAFGTAPNNPVYFGSDTSSSNQGDATFSNIVFDNTAPSISLTALSPDPTNDSTPALTGTATEAIGTVSSVEFQMDGTGGSWTACTADDGAFDEASEAFTCTVASALSDGSNTMYVRATDSNGNTTSGGSESSDTFTVDTAAPSVSVTAYTPDPSTDTTPSITGTATDATTALTDIEFQVDSTLGAWTNCAADDGTIDETSEAYTCTTSALSDGAHTIYIRATDSASNTTALADYGQDTFTVDSGGPTVTLTAISPDPTTDNTPTISGTVSDSTGTVSTVEFQVDATAGSWTACTADDGAFDEASETFSCTTTALADGSHTIYVRATDDASNTGSNASDTFTVDTTSPTDPNLDSPGGNSYTNATRPTFKWKTSTDATSSISGYELEVDNGDTGDFSVTSIPASRTTNYETDQFVITYDGFSDSDSTNNYIGVYTKDHSSWATETNNAKLKEGKRTWRVKVNDTAGNQAVAGRDLFVDLTSPSLSDIQINGTGVSDSIATTDTMPTFSGKVTDTLAGDKTENKVASGPNKAEIKIEKSQFGIYSLHSTYTINIDKTYWTSDGSQITDNAKNSSNKYGTFSYELTQALPNGTYEVTITGSDGAGNSSSSSFDLVVGGLQDVVTEEEEEVIEERIHEELEQEDEEVTEEKLEEEIGKVEVTKPMEPSGPSILETVSRGVVNLVSTTYWGIVDTTKIVATVVVDFTKNISLVVKSSATSAGVAIANISQGVFDTTELAVSSAFSAVGNNLSSLSDVVAQAVSQVPPLKMVVSVIGEPVSSGLNSVESGVSLGVGAVVATVNNSAKALHSVGDSAYEVISGTVGLGLGRVANSILEGTTSVSSKLAMTAEVWFDREETQIHNVSVIEVGPNYAIIGWETNHFATSKVNWGDSFDYGKSVQSIKKVKVHRVKIDGLEPGKAYYYEVMSQGKNYVFDARHEFTTPASE